MEWLIADLACFSHAGMVSVPLLASSEAELAELLRHSRVEVLVCSRRWTLRVLRAVARARLLPLRLIIQVGFLLAFLDDQVVQIALVI